MVTISQALSTALAHHQAGRLDLAQAIYQRILAAEPDEPDALHLSGLVIHQQGQSERALGLIARAIALRPQMAAYHSNQGEVLRALGRHHEALASYQRALALEPDAAPTHNNLGIVLHTLERADEAVACFRRAIELQPNYAEAYSNLGSTLAKLGQTGEAIACLQQALQLQPQQAAAYTNLGVALLAQGRASEAIVCLRRAVDLQPDLAEAHANLGNALRTQSQFQESIDCYRRAIELVPGDAALWNNLGAVLQALNRLDEAIACHRRAMEISPDKALACSNLAAALQAKGRLDEAAQLCRRALELDPGLADARSNLLLSLEYAGDVGPAALAEEYAEYDRRHAAPLAPHGRAYPNSRDPQRRLRLGFVSADFRRHPVGYFYLRPLECLRNHDFELVCYATCTRSDDFTARFRTAAHEWRDVPGISDAALADLVRADGVDVLFDLASHGGGCRLLTFARHPAPLQIGWAGPTGLSAMDYLLTDRHLLPPGAERQCREQPLRLPDAYACYESPADAPLPGDVPCAARGQVTFGSMNNLAKITLPVIRLWAEVLRRVPRAQLLMRYGGAAVAHDTQQRLGDAFAQAGIAPSRIEMVGMAPYAQRLELYRQIDIALDPFPFTGCTTTCEALWMGVPVITFPGPTYLSRQSTSILHNAGCPELVARDPDDYVARAVALAEDPRRLKTLRAELRGQMARAPLCDGRRFADNLAGLLRGVWGDWCCTSEGG
jgi:predicted O-linked N-acetylglucosamine transferase (SPINDLY family)